MTPPCVVPTFRPYTSENLEFGGSVPRVAKVGLGRLDRVRGVRFLRLTRRAADGPAQPEMTLSGPEPSGDALPARLVWDLHI